MNVRNTLIWTIIYTSLIYRKNVVYCTGSEDQSSQQSQVLSPDSNEHQQENDYDSLTGLAQESSQTSSTTGTDDYGTTPVADGFSTATLTSCSDESAEADDSSGDSNEQDSSALTPQTGSTTIPESSQIPDETATTVPFSQDSTQSTGFDLENYPDLKRQLHSMNRLKLIDLLGLVVNKVMSLENGYNFEAVVKSYRDLCKDYGPVGINIQAQQTDKFDRTVDANTNIVTFTCKQDHPFNLVKLGEMVIWHTICPREYLVKVEREGDNLTLYDLYGNAKEVPIEPIQDVKTVKKTLPDRPVSSDSSNCSNDANQLQSSEFGGTDSLALHGLDPNSVSSLPVNTQNIDIFDHSYCYTIYKLSESTRKIWTPVLEDQSFKLFYQKTSQGKRLLGLYAISDLFVPPGSVQSQSPLDLNYITLDVDHKEATSYIDYEFDDADKVHIFDPIRPYIINSVLKGGEPIWKNDDEDLAKYPLSVGFKENNSIYIDFIDFYLKYTKNDQGVWTHERLSYPDPTDGETQAIKMVGDSSGEEDSSSEEEPESDPTIADADEENSQDQNDHLGSLASASYSLSPSAAGSFDGGIAPSSIESVLPDSDSSSSFRGSTCGLGFQSYGDQDGTTPDADGLSSESTVADEDTSYISSEASPVEAVGDDTITPSPETGAQAEEYTTAPTLEFNEPSDGTKAPADPNLPSSDPLAITPEAGDQSSDLAGDASPPTTPPANESSGTSILM